MCERADGLVENAESMSEWSAGRDTTWDTACGAECMFILIHTTKQVQQISPEL